MFRSLVTVSLMLSLSPAALGVRAGGDNSLLLSTTDVEKEVLSANNAMIAAANRLDVDALFACVEDGERSSIIQNGVLFNTVADAKSVVKRGLEGVSKIDRRIENPKVIVLAPDAALLVGEGSTIATLSDGRTIENRFAVSLVFVCRDGNWKLLHGHFSMPVRST